MVYYFLFITLKKNFSLFILKALKDILLHFKFVNWRIRFLMSRTGYFSLNVHCFLFKGCKILTRRKVKKEVRRFVVQEFVKTCNDLVPIVGCRRNLGVVLPLLLELKFRRFFRSESKKK